MKKLLTSIQYRSARYKSKIKQFGAQVKRLTRRHQRVEIEVITMIYNEAFLAPLFVRHYAPWVDKFTVFYSQSIDDTWRELEMAAIQCGVKNLRIVPFEFPKGFDDELKIARLNQAVRESSADFVICVDADEFVHPWPFEGTNPREELVKEAGDVVYCAMFQSYRHATDIDIDRTKPPLLQRRHGAVDAASSVDGIEALQKDRYTKPCIVRPASGAQFQVGCHHLVSPKSGSTVWRGVHWGKADSFCLLRYVRDRRDRLSDENKLRRHGVENFNITESKILAELKAHENDPRLF